MAKKGKKQTTDEMLQQVAAIFHLEGRDIPPKEFALLKHHFEAGTLDEYRAKLLTGKIMKIA